MTTEDDNNNETPSMFDELKQIIGMDFHMEIKDGVFCITPAEAAIALFSATAATLANMENVWDEIDAANAKYLELKNRTDEQQQLLEACWNSFLVKGFDNEADILENFLWPVIGILEDGTEVNFGTKDTFQDFLDGFHKHTKGEEE
jgi:hypothetical protein